MDSIMAGQFRGIVAEPENRRPTGRSLWFAVLNGQPVETTSARWARPEIAPASADLIGRFSTPSAQKKSRFL